MPLTESRAQRVIDFIHEYCRVPEGDKVGQPLRLEDFQTDFIRDIYDNPDGTHLGILSMARKNGKTAIIACILLAHIAGPEAQLNSQVVSGALSRDQAALVFKLAAKMIDLSPELSEVCRIVPSHKQIFGLAKNVEYRALSADGGKNMGLSPVLAIGDEWGQVTSETNLFIESLVTSQGAYDQALMLVISTQAPSDTAWLSIQIDDAIRSEDPHTVCHLYAAEPDCELMDEAQWAKANPALGIFRSEKGLRKDMEKGNRIPSAEAGCRNLLLNQRISLTSLWVPPSYWKACAGEIDWSAFKENTVSLGLDLSQRQDLTAAVFAARDEGGVVHLYPRVYTPAGTAEARSIQDRVSYTDWIRRGLLVGVPGNTISYDYVCEDLVAFCDDHDIEIDHIEFDRWRIDAFKMSAERAAFGGWADWHSVGQGYKDFSPRCENFMALLLDEKIRHGGHPLLQMSAANAIAVPDPAGSIKLDKSKSTARIDPLVAAVMAVYPVSEGEEEAFSTELLIG